MDSLRFKTILYEFYQSERLSLGIGTLGEKTLHSMLKKYYEPNTLNHEIPVFGYVADICTDGHIIEIQTKNFQKLRPKLEMFLKFTDVTIVHPILNQKWLIWVDKDTGAIENKKRKSSKIETIYDVMPELYKIRDFLCYPNLYLTLPLLEVEEYKYKDGYGRYNKLHATKIDRYPKELISEFSFQTKDDYAVFIPPILKERFTSRDFAIAAHISLSLAQLTLLILSENIGILERVGKEGNRILYQRIATEI